MLNSEHCIWHLNSTWLGRSFRTSSQLSGLSSDCTHISLISGSARQMTSVARNRTRGRRRLGSLHVSHCPISRVHAPATLPVSILYDVSIKRLHFMRPSSLGGVRILRRTLSVRLSVCPSVPLLLPSVTSRHLANYNDTHVLFGKGRISYGHLGRTNSCYYLNNSVNISTDFDIFGTQHPEDT